MTSILSHVRILTGAVPFTLIALFYFAFHTERAQMARVSGDGSRPAANFIVTRTDDRNATCVSGVDCSLREAVSAARTGGGDDIIEFAADVNLITLTNEIEIVSPSGSITINGRGASGFTIDGGPGSNRIFSTLNATVTLTEMKLTGGNGGGNNLNGAGGALLVDIGYVTLDRVHVTGNSLAGSAGGGMTILNGTLRVLNSTISGNNAFNCGGISNSGSQVFVANTTISGNTASQLGGGMCANGNTTLRNVTITGNQASTGGGILKATTGTLNLGNTIVAGNSYTEIRFNQHPGTITSAGNNLIGDAPGDSINTEQPIAYQPSDILDSPLYLGPLRNNGGPTPTHSFLVRSPAIDGGSPELAIDPSNGLPLTTDQRGFARFEDGDGNGVARVDIGAFELRSQIVENTNDRALGSLRQSMADAPGQADAIIFNPVVFSSPQTIVLTTGELTVAPGASLSIFGPGMDRLTISGNNESRILFMGTAASLSISQMKLTAGNGVGAEFPDSGGAIFNREGFLTAISLRIDGNSTTAANGSGGGIYNYHGETRVFTSVLSNNSGQHGGAIYNSDGAVLEIVTSDVANNSAAFGAGINNRASLTLRNASVRDNDATANGGGVFNSGTVAVLLSTLASNTAVGNGGAVFNSTSSTVTLNDSILTTNSAGNGGGISSNGTANIATSTISRNSSSGRGGGIDSVGGALSMRNSTVSGNTAVGNGGGLYVDVTSPMTATLTNTTVAYNSGGNGHGYWCTNGSVTARNSIFANNGPTGSGADILGNLASLGYNLVRNPAGSIIGGNTIGNITGVDPLLDPVLRLNAGVSWSHALKLGSPAIDKGGSGEFGDQRGVVRPVEFPGIPNAPGGNGSDIGSFERRTNEPPPSSPFDFDGDRKTDIGIFRPSGGEWWVNRSGDGQTFALQFGASTDKIVPADYTGDGKADVAIFRPSSGEWYVLRSDDFSFFALPFGTNGDVPVPADYDADGKADFAVFRPSSSTWFISQSSGAPTRIVQFGSNGDQPVVSDYDGDGKADIGIFRQAAGGAEWWIDRSTAGLLAMQFGASTDKAVQGDYTGDGKTDIAIWRPSTGEWFIVRSEDFSFYGFPFGATGDIVAPGDYDGDGKFDVAVFRPSSATWFISRTTAGTQIVQFGATGDRPLPNAFVP